MRQLRSQLIGLLDKARKQQRQGPLPMRLAAAMTHNFFSLLRDFAAKRIDLRWTLISHARLHRHLICIRCPDQAFYLDGIKNYLNRRGIQTLEQQTLVADIDCEGANRVLVIRPADESHHNNFMFVALHISATLVPNGETLSRDLWAILQAVDLSVRDFQTMQSAIVRYINRLSSDEPEAAKLLAWMNDSKYLYFGLMEQRRRYGLMRNKRLLAQVAKGLAGEIDGLPPAEKPGMEWLYLGAARNYLYSATSLDVVRISWRAGRQLGSAILLGHFSRSARYTNASRVPYIRRIWETLRNEPLLKQSAFYRREMRTVFDRMAKPILLTIPVKRFLIPLKEIIDMASPIATRTAIWQPHPGNVNVLLTAIPATRFGPNVLANILNGIQALGPKTLGQESFAVGLHRLLFITLHGDIDSLMEKKLDTLIHQSVLFWKDRAKAVVLEHAEGLNVPDVLADIERLPPLYQDLFDPGQIMVDLATRNRVRADGRTRVRIQKTNSELDLYIFSSGELALGQLVTAIQAFGITALQESVVSFPGEPSVYLSSIRCGVPDSIQAISIEHLTEALDLVLNGEADDDMANALIISASLNIAEVAIIISLRNYLIQMLADAAPTPLTQMLLQYPRVSARLLRLFEARHRTLMSLTSFPQAEAEFAQAMNEVQSLTDDRWFRALEEIVEATVRSNAFTRQPEEPVSIKINPAHLSFVPKPVPFREIFVHGTHVEGIHLRAGPIARGGIRFSDRPADYRTEVLELMATQVVKNGQIIPTGSKGGFVVRGGQGEAFVQSQYRTFIRALLRLTDNRRRTVLVPPPEIKVLPEDKNDAYLVVAADKGTARYSDLANDEAGKARFWLDDAFASGGKHGYDHKAFGITARGAWVCVREHFSALGIHSDEDPISVVGIGDMSGDVFGNGMLQSENLRLIGAFNHKHIFLDPVPDPAASFSERQRLFQIRGGWDQYDSTAISSGGGVFLRTAKRIPISPEMRAALGVENKEFSGEALIRTLLAAPVDLLYNGGIGTYVRASGERNSEVMDPANNAVRITARELRCRVVAEGGNLGFTQQARIEFAARHGRINTDAIDNSAGVDMSDHEVNLKILFASSPALQKSRSRRNRLLASLASAVADQCLANNLYQSRALSLAEREATDFAPKIQRLRNCLIQDGRIDPQTDAGMEEDGTLGLRPQLAVLLGHEKNRIHQAFSDEGFARRSCFHEDMLYAYFPKRIQRHYQDIIHSHPLADEITHTMVANHLINNFGLCCIHHLQTLIDATPASIAQSLLVAEFILDGAALRASIWHEVGEMEPACLFQSMLQGSLIQFAEDLLRLCPIDQLDKAWMRKQRRQFQRYRHGLHSGNAKFNSEKHTALLREAKKEGLNKQSALDIATISELAQTGVSVHLSSQLRIPLIRCLRATRICLHLLPFSVVEASLRSPAWGDQLAHELRREWLHRLCLLKSRAIQQLLKTPGRDPVVAAGKLWGQHRYWENIQQIKNQFATGEESNRMLLLLLLTQMEALVDESGVH